MKTLDLLEQGLPSLRTWIKNGFYVHIVHAFLQGITGNTYLSATLSIKLYSLNYFYWYGHLYTYGRKATIGSRSSEASEGFGSMYTYLPRHNWVKQFIRLTDTGHMASFALLIGPLFVDDFVQRFLPLAHNVHLIIMAGYWLSKGVLEMKDADRLVAPDLHEGHMDLLTYVHHTVPYLLLHLFPVPTDCDHAYSSTTLLYTYGWLYGWLILIYCPWRIVTGDTVYSILDTRQTPLPILLGFLVFMHALVWSSNTVGATICQLRNGAF